MLGHGCLSRKLVRSSWLQGNGKVRASQEEVWWEAVERILGSEAREEGLLGHPKV